MGAPSGRATACLRVRSRRERDVSTQRWGSWLRSRHTHSHTPFFSFLAYTEAPAFSSHTYGQVERSPPPRSPPPASASSARARAGWCSPRVAAPSRMAPPRRQFPRRRCGELPMTPVRETHCPARRARASPPAPERPVGRCPAPRCTGSTPADAAAWLPRRCSGPVDHIPLTSPLLGRTSRREGCAPHPSSPSP